MSHRIAVVEDDAAIAGLLDFTLRRAGFEPIVAGSAEEAVARFADALPDVAVIDWMLPGESGLWLVERLRADPRSASLPIMMVSAMVEDSRRIAGIEARVDDYVAKPFSPRDLVVRINALLRCREPAASGEAIVVGPLRLDPTTRTLTVDGRVVALRLIEFQLLRVLMSRPGATLPRAELRDGVWGDADAVGETTVDMHMRRLRHALGVEGREFVELTQGGGYRLIAERAAPTPLPIDAG